MKIKSKLSKIPVILIHVFILVFTYFPLFFMIISSLKTNEQIMANYFAPTLPFRFENYAIAFSKVIDYLGNSLIISGLTAAGVIFFGCITAYVFARFSFPGKELIYIFILAFTMMPSILTLIPSFVLINRLGLVNTYWSCILPYIASGQIIYIMVLRSFIEGLPGVLFDAAKIDGAKNIRIFIEIVFPLSKQIIISLVLLNILTTWNDFIWPLLTLSKEAMKTVTVGLYSFTDVQQIQYGYMFAGFVLASVPLVILFSLNMKNFVNGITLGAVKE